MKEIYSSKEPNAQQSFTTIVQIFLL